MTLNVCAYQAMIGLCVQHDANHGAASRDARVNSLLGFGADLIGGCKYLWMEQHWSPSHHPPIATNATRIHGYSERRVEPWVGLP